MTSDDELYQEERRNVGNRVHGRDPGVIGFGSPLQLTSCFTLDSSPSGRRLALPQALSLPDHIWFRDLADDVIFDCLVVWRGKLELGVEVVGRVLIGARAPARSIKR